MLCSRFSISPDIYFKLSWIWGYYIEYTFKTNISIFFRNIYCESYNICLSALVATDKRLFTPYSESPMKYICKNFGSSGWMDYWVIKNQPNRRLYLTLNFKCLKFPSLISVAPNDVIWKTELYVRIMSKNLLNRPFNGSSGSVMSSKKLSHLNSEDLEFHWTILTHDNT